MRRTNESGEFLMANVAWKRVRRAGGRFVDLLTVILGGIALLLLLQRFGYLLPSPKQSPSPAQERGVVAPDFSLPSLNGEEIRLSSLQGKVVLLSFWATWCPPCKAEMPSMQKLYEAYRDRGFTVLAVSSDRQGRTVVVPFMEEYGLTFPALLDPSGSVGFKYGVNGIPTNLVLDKQSRIAYRGVGPRDWNSTASFQLVEQLLGEPSATSKDGKQRPVASRMVP